MNKTKPKPPEEKADKKTLEIIEREGSKLLKLMGFKQVKLDLVQDGETIKINIDCLKEETLVGVHGEVISAFQLILSLIVYKKLGYWQKLLVDTAGWLEKRKRNLEKIALNAAQKVKFSGKDLIIPRLNSAERRVVHLALADHPDVFTKSEGIGKDRHLIVGLKNNLKN